MKKKLHLSLKTKWYKMIESGEKKEEYREITPYWIRRIVISIQPLEMEPIKYRHYDEVEFTLGYPKKDDKSRRMTYKVERIDIGFGNKQWGAPIEKQVFIISLGSRVS